MNGSCQGKTENGNGTWGMGNCKEQGKDEHIRIKEEA
jgi:hypothetical protein